LPHGSAQVVPAAQSALPLPLQFTWHAPPSPHSTVQPAEPVQSAVHPPFGHWIVHVLLPVQLTVEPVSTLTVHVLPPAQLTVLFVPASRSHVLVPAQLEVQFEPQVPSQVDWPAHCEVQPVPHERSQVFFD
jgi:hypothetical protein